MKADEILDQAAVEVSKGWAQGVYVQYSGEDRVVCAMGAMAAARYGLAGYFYSHPDMEMTSLDPEFTKGIRVLARVMAEQYPEFLESEEVDPDSLDQYGYANVVVTINDCHVQTGAEVAACMEKAATALREQR